MPFLRLQGFSKLANEQCAELDLRAFRVNSGLIEILRLQCHFGLTKLTSAESKSQPCRMKLYAGCIS